MNLFQHHSIYLESNTFAEIFWKPRINNVDWWLVNSNTLLSRPCCILWAGTGVFAQIQHLPPNIFIVFDRTTRTRWSRITTWVFLPGVFFGPVSAELEPLISCFASCGLPSRSPTSTSSRCIIGESGANRRATFWTRRARSSGDGWWRHRPATSLKKRSKKRRAVWS